MYVSVLQIKKNVFSAAHETPKEQTKITDKNRNIEETSYFAINE